MMKLINKKTNKVILSNVIVANNFYTRAIGLMFKSHFDSNSTLWILQTNWIQTFFMKFKIDAVYVNKDLIVKEIHYNLKPWRFAPIVWGANSVFEMNAGIAKENSIQIGDQLHVGH